MKKMIIFKLLVCCVAVLCAICVLASCENDSGHGEKVDGYSAETLDNLPADLDFKGKQVNIFYWGSNFVEWELTSDGSSGDIVEKSVSKRNNAVESRLGVKLNYIKGETPAEVFSPTVRDEVMSGSKDYDLIVAPQTTGVHNVKDGVYRDVKDFKYLDLSQPYWNDEYNQALSVNNKRFMVGGDISLTTIAWGSTMFIEKEPFEQLFGDMEEFYEFVYDGNWTLDEYAERCKQCYRDLNGNGLKDPEDQFGTGIGVQGHSVADVYCFSSGITYSKRDENGLPVIDMKNDRTLEFVDKFSNLIYNNPGVIPITSEVSEKYGDDIKHIFSAGAMQNAVERRGDDDDFGIVPVPKLNDEEPKYHAWLSDCTASFSVPITEDDDKLDMCGAVLECLASETRRLCFPEYFERALKSKYIRDSWSAKMLDLIHEGLTTDFVSCYGDCLEGMGNFMRLVMYGSEPNFVSNYDAKEGPFLQKLKELFDAFEQNTGGKDFVPETTTTISEDDKDKLTIACNDISSYWFTLGTKYKKSGIWAKEDLSEHFSYAINSNDEIEVRSPHIKICGGYYPTAAIVSRDTLPLKDLCVTFHIDEGFDYTNTGWSSSFSVVWSDKPFTSLPKYLEGIGTNGLRELVDEDTKGLCVSFMGAQGSGTTADLIYVILYDGEGSRPEVDNRLGYRFTNYVNTDLGQTCKVEVKEDDELGYVVVVNDTEYRTGERGKTTYDIDLNILKDVEEGHLGIGGESTLETYCNWTLCTINGKGAGSFFD